MSTTQKASSQGTRATAENTATPAAPAAKSTGKSVVTLPNDFEVVVVREFAGPRQLVYDAWTRPEILRRWMGAGMPGWAMTVCEMDVRVGGKFHWRWRNENGSEFGFTGEFREVVRPSRTVHTEAFDPGTMGGTMGDEPALVTSVFAEKGPRVTLHTMTIRYASKADRDAALATGMTDGMEISYTSLDAMLAQS